MFSRLFPIFSDNFQTIGNLSPFHFRLDDPPSVRALSPPQHVAAERGRGRTGRIRKACCIFLDKKQVPLLNSPFFAPLRSFFEPAPQPARKWWVGHRTRSTYTGANGLSHSNSTVLETASRLTVFAFDKTGTLTFGKLMFGDGQPTSRMYQYGDYGAG